MYSGYSGHVDSGHWDIVATFPGTKYIYSIIFRSDIVGNWIVARKCWPKVVTISEVHCIVRCFYALLGLIVMIISFNLVWHYLQHSNCYSMIFKYNCCSSLEDSIGLDNSA